MFKCFVRFVVNFHTSYKDRCEDACADPLYGRFG